jgi:phospholipid transport system substrate-binding protein
MHTYTKFMVALLLAAVASLALAQAQPRADVNGAPDVLVKSVTAEVLAIIRQDKDIQAGVPAKIGEVVEAKILPLFDFARMTQLAVARNWRVATPEQQKLLTTEFRTLLVRTYSTALANYRDQVIEFKPLRAAPGDTEVTVRSIVKQRTGDALTMDYELEKNTAGWKVFDIKVDGISLITTYRDTFASKVRTDGVDGLINSLADKNRQGDARWRSHQTDKDPFPAILRVMLQGN